MKKLKTIYWVLTGLFAAFVAITSLSQLTMSKSAIEIMEALMLPAYLLPFLAAAKLLGLTALLSPGFKRLKEWAYAGFTFDFLGATYCMIAVGGSIGKWAFMLVPVLLCAGSYIYYHKKEVRRIALTQPA